MRLLALLLLLSLSCLPASAADSNSVTVVGNVWAVSRTVHTGASAPSDAITVFSAARVEIGAYLVVSLRCPAALGCFDSWWLSSRCTSSTSTTTSPGTTQTVISCVPHSSLDGTDSGACVEVAGHLSPDPQTGDNVVYPDTLTPLAWWICDTKP